MLEFERADHVGAEPQREDHQALGFRPGHRHPGVLGGVVHHHRLAGGDGLAAERLQLGRHLAPSAAADLAAVGHRHDVVLIAPVDPEVAPVEQAMRQPLDLLEGVHQRHVGRDRRLHQVDLVEVLRGDGLLEDLLGEEPEHADHRQHRGPARRAQHPDGADDDRRGAQREEVGHHLVAQDEQPLLALELVAEEQGEVEERARAEEVDAGRA